MSKFIKENFEDDKNIITEHNKLGYRDARMSVIVFILTKT